VAALFPDRFEDSEVGLIPEHWAVRSVPEVFEINPARELQKGTIAPYLSMQSTPTSGPVPDLLETRRYGSGVRFRNGDSLVAKITPCLENGKTAFVNFLEEHEVGWGSTEFIVLRSKQGIPPVFSYFFARDDGFRGHAIANMTGSSGRQRVPASSLERFRFPLPSPPILEFFGKLADAAMAVIGENVAQSRTLAELRDLLLPKLLSGEIRLAEAEEAVEAMGA
jgi:type I restriction enzyme S subunit